MLQLIFILTTGTVLLLVYPFLQFLLQKQTRILRLKRYIAAESIQEEKKKSGRKEIRRGFGFITNGIGNLKFLARYKKNIQMQLIRAYILLRAEEFLTVNVLSFLAAGLITFLLMGGDPANQSIFLAFVAALLGWTVPNLILKRKIKSRMKAINDQLCDTISLLSNSLKAGYSFMQAVETVAKEMTGPMAEEFNRMKSEMNLGVNTETALQNLVNRVSSDDLELMVTAVLIQRQIGGNLAVILDNISSTIRERIKIKGEVKTVTAQGRMSAIVISLLPPTLGFMVFIINPEHIGLLFKSPIGIAILAFSVIMELTGIFFIKKAIRIEF